MSRMNFAIIGCGHIGRRHAKHCRTLGRLAAVCDIDRTRADQLAGHGTNAYSSIGDLLENEKELDLVAICTPNGLHALHSIQALQAGFHVLCEKPMAIHVADCEQMIAAAAGAKKELFIVKQNRYNPPVAAVKELLDKNQLGRISSVQVNCCWHRGPRYYEDSWHGSKDLDGGILYTQFSHFIDLLYWMIGEVKEVAAFTGNFTHTGSIEFGDTGVAILQFRSGALGSLHFTINAFRQNMEGSLTIVAEKGTVKIGGQYLNKLEYQQLEEGMIGELSPGNTPNDYGHYQGSMSNHDKVYQHVLDVITKGHPNQFSGLDGLRTVEIIEKIYSAAK